MEAVGTQLGLTIPLNLNLGVGKNWRTAHPLQGWWTRGTWKRIVRPSQFFQPNQVCQAPLKDSPAYSALLVVMW